MAFRSSTTLVVASLLAMQRVLADDATCGGGACEEPAHPEQMSILQVLERGRCAAEGSDPHEHGRNGRCCTGLTKVQGQFNSEKCTHQCFECTGRSGNKDPFSMCGGSCDQSMCEVPCCEGTYKIKGHWNSGTCTYQCMCAGYGQDTYQYCAGENPCGGQCHVPCCFPLTEVTEGGRRICRHWGEALARARFVAAEAQAEAQAAVEAAERSAEKEGVAEDLALAARRKAADRVVGLQAKASALAEAAKRFEQRGPPQDPLVVAATAAAAGKDSEPTDSEAISSDAAEAAEEEGK